MSDETRKVYQETRRQVVENNRALNTLKMAYKEQHQTLNIAAGAFRSVGSAVKEAQTMYTQYNVAMIRTQQLSDKVKDAQEKYNQAVRDFGPNSNEAKKAYGELQKASKDLEDQQEKNKGQLIGFVAEVPGFLQHVVKIKDNFSILASQLQNTDVVKWCQNAGTAITTFSTTAITAIKAVAIELGLLTGGLTLLGSEIYRDVSKQKELLTTTGLTQDEFDMLSGLAQGLGISVGRLTEAIEDGRIKVAQYGKEWASLEEKIRKAKQSLAAPGVPPMAPTIGPVTQPPATACPYCGEKGGNHKPWCPVLSNEWYGFQAGGIVTKPTFALLGERGPEAVVPLREGSSGPMRTDVQVNTTIRSLHVSNEQQVQEFFDRLQRKIVKAVQGIG